MDFKSRCIFLLILPVFLSACENNPPEKTGPTISSIEKANMYSATGEDPKVCSFADQIRPKCIGQPNCMIETLPALCKREMPDKVREKYVHFELVWGCSNGVNDFKELSPKQKFNLKCNELN